MPCARLASRALGRSSWPAGTWRARLRLRTRSLTSKRNWRQVNGGNQRPRCPTRKLSESCGRGVMRYASSSKRCAGLTLDSMPRSRQARLARYKTYLDRRMAEVKERISKGDYAKREKIATELDKEAKLKRFQLSELQKEFNQGVINLKLANRTRVEKLLGGGRQVLNTSRALITSADLSAVLRQGGFIALGHPVRAATSFGPMLRAFRSEQARFEINQEIRDRPNAPLYEQSKLYLHDERDLMLEKMEEAYMSRWAGKIPIVAGSERAYTTFLNKLRADSFDAMIKTLGRGGHEITLKESKAIANYINVATGRGNLDGVAKAAANLNTIFFAPRYVASRFQLMLGEPLYGGTAATRRMIALEYGRALTGLGRRLCSRQAGRRHDGNRPALERLRQDQVRQHALGSDVRSLSDCGFRLSTPDQGD